jgi:beta-galactosidase
VVDHAGVTAPRANDHIKFTIEGPGEIVATDNGDPASFEPFPSPERNAFNGVALAIVRATRGPGRIRISAHSGTLQGGSITVQSIGAPKEVQVLDLDFVSRYNKMGLGPTRLFA